MLFLCPIFSSSSLEKENIGYKKIAFVFHKGVFFIFIDVPLPKDGRLFQAAIPLTFQ